MNIAIKLNKYINIEYCNNRRAIPTVIGICCCGDPAL